jgi:RHS repeat-associated protein
LQPRSDAYNNRDLLNSDTNGNTTVGGVGDPGLNGTDTYDFEDRLIYRLKADASSIATSYDADGIRRQKVLLDSLGGNLSTTNYLVDTNNHTGYAQVLEERKFDTSGTTVKTYPYGTDLIAVPATESALITTSYYTYDGGGTVRELTDVTGAITDNYDYDAYGILIFSAGATDNAHLYRGEQFDGDVGLYYLRARFMSPDSGRFGNMDTYKGSAIACKMHAEFKASALDDPDLEAIWDHIATLDH